MGGIIITGATGMVGVALTKLAISRGVKVAALVRPGSPRSSRLPRSQLVRAFPADLDELENAPIDSIRAFLGGGRTVLYHAGWRATERFGRLDSMLQATNIGSTIAAVRLASAIGCGGFIGIGSQAEYGIHRNAITGPNDPTDPITAYGIAKLAAGKLGAIEAQRLNLTFAWVRIFSLYGDGEASNTMIQSLLPHMMRNEPCDLTQGTQLWDYLHVDDAAEALFLLGTVSETQEVYCLGSGEGRPIREWVCEMKNAIGSSSELRFGTVPYELGVPNGMCADISQLVRRTGWQPKIAFRDGIRGLVS